MAKEWTPSRIKRRLREVLAEYEIPVPCSTICNRMPSCCCDAVRHGARQMEIDGEIAITGTAHRALYELSRKAEFASLISNLWRREPVFTELRVCK
jgi:hypothetical protein